MANEAHCMFSQARVEKIFLLKMLTKYREFFSTLFVTDFHDQLVFNFEQTPTVTLFEERGIMAHIP